MTKTELRNLVALQLGFRADQNTNIETALAYVQSYILEQAEVTPAFLLRTANFTVLAGDSSHALPEDFSRMGAEWSQTGVDLTAYAGVVFEKPKQLNENTVKGNGEFALSYPTGSPTQYAISYSDSTLQFAPVLGEDASFSIWYICKEPALSDEAPNNWQMQAADWLLWQTVCFLGQPLGKDISLAQGELERAKSRLLALELSRQSWNNGPLVVGQSRLLASTRGR